MRKKRSEGEGAQLPLPITPPSWARKIPGIDAPLPEKPAPCLNGRIVREGPTSWRWRFYLGKALVVARADYMSEREAIQALREEAASRELPLKIAD